MIVSDILMYIWKRCSVVNGRTKSQDLTFVAETLCFGVIQCWDIKCSVYRAHMTGWEEFSLLFSHLLCIRSEKFVLWCLAQFANSSGYISLVQLHSVTWICPVYASCNLSVRFLASLPSYRRTTVQLSYHLPTYPHTHIVLIFAHFGSLPTQFLFGVPSNE